MLDAIALHRLVLRWYALHARDFPWRRTRDPYVILIAEIMLQQTQADRVEEKLPIFLKRFPAIGALARARRSSVVKAWAGMGYNRRAVHLHDAAREVVRLGAFPAEVDALRALPGIGRYAASAILCFAHGKRVPVVDVNIRRVLSRVIAKRAAFDDLLDVNTAWERAKQVLPRRSYYEWNQALMDIGARFCMARRVLCDACPLRSVCPSSSTLLRRMARSPRTRHLAAAKRSEPMRNGIPNRLWRGKIVGALRVRSFATLHDLGKAVDPRFWSRGTNGTHSAHQSRKSHKSHSIDDTHWLTRLVAALVRDGLVRRDRGRIRLA